MLESYSFTCPDCHEVRPLDSRLFASDCTGHDKRAIVGCLKCYAVFIMSVCEGDGFYSTIYERLKD